MRRHLFQNSIDHLSVHDGVVVAEGLWVKMSRSPHLSRLPISYVCELMPPSFDPSAHQVGISGDCWPVPLLVRSRHCRTLPLQLNLSQGIPYFPHWTLVSQVAALLTSTTTLPSLYAPRKPVLRLSSKHSAKPPERAC
jgi:hypothetical protein